MGLRAADRRGFLQRALRLEYLTVGWNVVEGVIAVTAGLIAGSPALLGFGFDSGIESISGSVLIWRLLGEVRGRTDEPALERIERRAEWLVGASFLLLSAYVVFDAGRSLFSEERPDTSRVGIAVTALSIGVMLWLARAKRDTGRALNSRALIADAKQTSACWYLSFAALAGLGLNAVVGWSWADPVAALAISVFLIREGVEALRGEDY